MSLGFCRGSLQSVISARHALDTRKPRVSIRRSADLASISRMLNRNSLTEASVMGDLKKGSELVQPLQQGSKRTRALSVDLRDIHELIPFHGSDFRRRSSAWSFATKNFGGGRNIGGVKSLRFSCGSSAFLGCFFTLGHDAFVSIQCRQHLYRSLVWRRYLPPARADAKVAREIPVQVGRRTAPSAIQDAFEANLGGDCPIEPFIYQ